MNIKNLIFTIAALAFAALSAWKGPTVAGAIAGALVALCVLALSLHVVPPGAQEYIEDLEEALQKNAPDAAAKVVKKSDNGPKGGAIALLLVGIGWGSMALTNVRDVHAPRALPVLSLEACTGNAQQDAKTANDWINGFLNSASYACTQLSQVSDVQQLAIVCGIINMGDKLAPAVEHFIESLILGRQAALAKGMMFDHAGAVWFKPALDGGAQ